MRARRLFLLSPLLSCLSLTCCVQPLAKSYAALNGNWHIAGGPNSSQYPLLALTIVVNGDLVYGSGTVGVNCANSGSSFSLIGSGFSFTGQIASDGTFLLTNSSLDGAQIAIKGEVPRVGSTTWAGSFTITNAPTATSCSFDVSSNFLATAYPPLNGKYTGTITGPGLGSAITISTQVSQGALSQTPVPGGPSYALSSYIPLSATTTVSGSSCFATGTSAQATATSTLPPSTLNGDLFLLSYVMNDGSNFQILGWLSDPSESTLQVQVAEVVGGNCNGENGNGVLTLQ
jgi:hypothetical protein